MPQEITVKDVHVRGSFMETIVNTLPPLTGKQVYDFFIWLFKQPLPNPEMLRSTVHDLCHGWYTPRLYDGAIILLEENYCAIRLTRHGYANAKHMHSDGCLNASDYGKSHPHTASSIQRMLAIIGGVTQKLRAELANHSFRAVSSEELLKILYEKWQANENLQYAERKQTSIHYDLLV